ncbi:MAG: cyclase family protein [Firmicutes bacterium]|nr:cyclase family protein [Bacillota bacterium]
MHAGTHIDAPRHFLDCGKRIGDFGLEKFIGKGCLLDVRGESNIALKQEYFQLVQEGDIVLLFTGLGSLFRENSYYENFNDHPLVEIELAEFFVERKIKMLGMDTPKPDNFPFAIHKLLLSNGILIMENLNDLEKLVSVPSFEVIALPLKIHAEASIVRAVARVQ